GKEPAPRGGAAWLSLRPPCHAKVVLEPETVADYRIHHSIYYGPHGEARELLAPPYVARLAGGDLRHGLRLRAAGRRFAWAVIAFDDDGDHLRALRWTLAATVRAPLLL